MNNKLKLSTIVLATSLLSVNANANDTYAWVGFSGLNLDEKGSLFGVDYKASADFNTLSFGIGQELNEYFAIEGMFATGLDAGQVKLKALGTSTDFKLNLNTAFGVYGVGTFPINNTVSIYGKAGFMQASFSSISISVTQSSFSYGAGLNFNIDKTSSINLDYMNYYDKDSTTIDGIGLGYVVNF